MKRDQEFKTCSTLKLKKLINTGSKMSLAASSIGLCATVEYGLSPYRSQGSSDYTVLALCWVSGPGASWWMEVGGMECSHGKKSGLRHIAQAGQGLL